LHEVEQVADRVAILQRGRLIQTGTIKALLSRGSHIEISIASPEAAARVISALPFVERVQEVDGVVRVFAPPDAGPALARALSEVGLFPTAMTPVNSSLEEVFLGLTESSAEADE
jgi:ABC-type multidrug transport system ATPase subunit